MQLFKPLDEQEYPILIKYLRAKILERLGVKVDYEIDPTILVKQRSLNSASSYLSKSSCIQMEWLRESLGVVWV
jgi:hypothetical protein